MSPLLLSVLVTACGQAARPAFSPGPPTATLVSAPKPVRTFVLHFLDSERIEPAEVNARAGELVKLVLVGDHKKHDMTSPGLNINNDVLPGQVAIITVQLPATPGVYAFWSAQPGDQEAGMTGRFIVS